ncbi:xanthine dehydrogenase accessory protein XdhC [Sedimentitalea sp. CY04]|uniref:Xanthine dehydrogenase accessory protein XdhC n=1 Tax=Parasedimentitalea denitrificans TaxID=2211118 RepID=A0ABX0W6Q7_9RHOB|nr:xanthine dehydrogenase accessory protein XdhC [Sedimentitalea sp. CY04]NIZ61116.1 xanthine dehydrogenase accessory protein XdhC [Sedimentitalea sp. CY04]
MGFDLEGLTAAVEARGRVTRVVIADIRGSSPREVGAAMLVWKDGQSGTIGGGTLEFEAAIAARKQVQGTVLGSHALGPDLGQCCGGVVTLLSEVYDASRLAALDDEIVLRPVKTGADGATPLAVKRLLANARGQGLRPQPQLVDGWMVEPVHHPEVPLWIWGAGHVGRALVDVLSPLPDFSITWVDTAAERFPSDIPKGVTSVPAVDPALLVPHAPVKAQHLVLTYSHTLDLALCHSLLGHGFAFAGLIGSATKWARFRSRLAALGHSAEQISRITCPIGDPALGKHPQMIAVGVAAQLLRRDMAKEMKKDHSA